MQWYARHLCSIDWGIHLPSKYMHCPWFSNGCSSYARHLCSNWMGRAIWLLYICIVLDLALGVVVCKASMFRLTWGSICLLYICIFLDLAVGVVACKTSMLKWLGRSIMPSIYIHCPRSSSACSGMQGICAPLTRGSICLLYICIVLDLAMGVAACKASVLNWMGRATSSVMVFKASMFDWLGGPSVFYIYAFS